jgi:uncharacterized protein
MPDAAVAGASSPALRDPLQAACDSGAAALAAEIQTQPSQAVIWFTDSSGEPVNMTVAIAATPQQQERGLMDVAALPEDRGELFDFTNVTGGRETLEAFWMCHTLIPLSVAFIGKDQTVHEIQDMRALTLDSHMPRAPYLYAVEANLGWFALHNVTAGSRVDLSAVLNPMSQTPGP